MKRKPAKPSSPSVIPIGMFNKTAFDRPFTPKADPKNNAYIQEYVQEVDKVRVVTAPDAKKGTVYLARPHCGPLTVKLEENEEVNWIWNSGPDGVQRVIGYTITTKPHEPNPPPIKD